MELERALPGGPWGTELVQRSPNGVGQHYPQAVAEAPPTSDWHKYLLTIARHKWIVLAVTIAGTVLGILGTRFLDREYSAKAILWVERPQREQDRDVISAEVGHNLIEAPGWVQVVQSNAVLDSVVRQLRLYLTPKVAADAPALASMKVSETLLPGTYRVTVDRTGRSFELATEDGTVLQRGSVGDSIGLAQGIQWAPGADVLRADRKIEFTAVAPYEAAQDLSGRLKVRIDEGSNFLVIQLKGTDPVRTAQTVNVVAARAVTVAAEMKGRRFQELATILGEQYQSARARLDTAENALRNFRVRTAGMLGARSYGEVRTGDPTQNMQLAAAFEQMQRDRRAIDDAIYGRRDMGANIDALSSIPATQQSPQLAAAMAEVTRKQAQLRELQQRYTDEAAPVVSLRQEIDSLQRSAIPTMAAQVSSNLQSREQVFRPRVNAAVGAMRRMPTLELDDARLVRDVTSAEELNNNVRQRYEAARLALVSSLPDVRILDGAVVPHRPSISLAPVLIALAFLTSLGLAVAAVLLRDSVDQKVRYPEQVTQGMRLTILGAIPHVSSRSTNVGDDAAPVVEALRSLRLRVLHTHSGTGPLMLTVTSPAMGEGKSFVTSNLALSFAEAGYRVLLVDGDLRRGALNIIMGTEAKPGLTDVLAGQATVADVLKETSHAGLSFISAGTRLHRAPELLLSQKLKDVFEQVKGNYDVILVDSPPLAAGVDPIVFGAVTRDMMLILRSGRSELQLAAAKLEGMDHLPVRLIGAVLNDVRDGGAFRHYTYEDYTQLAGNGNGKDRPRILQGAHSDD